MGQGLGEPTKIESLSVAGKEILKVPFLYTVLCVFTIDSPVLSCA